MVEGSTFSMRPMAFMDKPITYRYRAKARFVAFLSVGLGELVFAVFAFVALSVVVKACFYIVLVATLWTFHNHRKYKRLNHLIILFAILSKLILTHP